MIVVYMHVVGRFVLASHEWNDTAWSLRSNESLWIVPGTIVD